jgi:hypothetical protein
MSEWKIYQLDNGDLITARQLSKKMNININTARCRLCNYTDPNKIYATQKKRGQISPPASLKPHPKKLLNKPFYDPMYRLALKVI